MLDAGPGPVCSLLHRAPPPPGQGSRAPGYTRDAVADSSVFNSRPTAVRRSVVDLEGMRTGVHKWTDLHLRRCYSDPTGTTAERGQLTDFTWVIKMLWTIFVVLLVLWFLGLVTSYTIGGYIHILLVVAVVALLIRVIQGRRIV